MSKDVCSTIATLGQSCYVGLGCVSSSLSEPHSSLFWVSRRSLRAFGRNYYDTAAALTFTTRFPISTFGIAEDVLQMARQSTSAGSPLWSHSVTKRGKAQMQVFSFYKYSSTVLLWLSQKERADESTKGLLLSGVLPYKLLRSPIVLTGEYSGDAHAVFYMFHTYTPRIRAYAFK